MTAGVDRDERARIHRQAASIVLAVAPFGVVFGAAAAEAGLRLIEAIGYSVLVFAGSSQFAAVEILGDGGSIASAVVAGLLLNVRSLAFGVIVAPALAGPLGRRLLLSQLVIDESTAVAVAQRGRAARRYGFVVAGVGVFVVWNLTTVLGFLLSRGAEGLIDDLGLDAAGPAAFLALLWPRLERRPQLAAAVVGGAIALVLVPLAPPGVPIVAAMAAVLVARLVPDRPTRSARPPGTSPSTGPEASP